MKRRFQLLLPFVVLLAGCAITKGERFDARPASCEILRTGVPARAIVLELRDLGTPIGDDPILDLVLRVLPVEGEPFDATVRALVSRFDLAQVQPGSFVPVRFERSEPQRLAIDLWECGSRPAEPQRRTRSK